MLAIVGVTLCSSLGGGALGYVVPTVAAQELTRRQSVASLLVGLGLSSATLYPGLARAAGMSSDWRKDLPRTLKGLRDLDNKWAEYVGEGSTYGNARGDRTKGANLVREALIIKSTDVLEFTIPSDQNLGVVQLNGFVKQVQRPEIGWKEDDYIAAINGISSEGKDSLLQQLVSSAKAEGQPLKVRVERSGPPLFDNLENKLKKAYLELGDDNLPDLEAFQVKVGQAKAAAQSAASSADVSVELMSGLKKELNAVAKLLEPYVQAIQG
eukprot:TRINITY_DN57920_c0_g1_i1.p1 TRINITY_DN57920_c0_g1~~TRINITY_DN57920_c0_g1_i1.p1  ORF type:complete len:288 (-),score=67.43 TRINITY_DN57920_c0_g1_i1:104-907(-)